MSASEQPGRGPDAGGAAHAAHAGQMVTFPVNGRSAEGYLALPPGGRGPGLLVLQEWWGLVEHIKDVADRAARAGFVALAPDLYHGERATSPDAAQKLLMALDLPRVSKDLAGAATYLRAHAAVEPKRVGVVGFCMGGQLALFGACEHPELIDAAVDFYGIHPNVTLDTSRLKAPVLAHFGRHDHSVPLDRAEALIADIRARGVEAEMHVYEAGHAFFNDARPKVYEPEAAQDAWERTVDFLRRHLA